MRYIYAAVAALFISGCGSITDGTGGHVPEHPQAVQYVTCRTVESKDPGPSQGPDGSQVYVVFSTSGHILYTDYYTWANADPGEVICGYWVMG